MVLEATLAVAKHCALTPPLQPVIVPDGRSALPQHTTVLALGQTAIGSNGRRVKRPVGAKGRQVKRPVGGCHYYDGVNATSALVLTPAASR